MKLHVQYNTVHTKMCVKKRKWSFWSNIFNIKAYSLKDVYFYMDILQVAWSRKQLFRSWIYTSLIHDPKLGFHKLKYTMAHLLWLLNSVLLCKNNKHIHQRGINSITHKTSAPDILQTLNTFLNHHPHPFPLMTWPADSLFLADVAVYANFA